MFETAFLSGESDFFVGRRGRLKRYLVCAMEGYFPVVVKTGPQSLATIFRTAAPHVGIKGTLAVSLSTDSGKSWSDPVEIQPRWLDNRNPSFGINARGELLAGFWKAGLHGYVKQSDGCIEWDATDEERMNTVPAMFITRSADGCTWSEPTSYQSTLLTLASPYGRIISCPDGTLLMSVYGKPRTPMTDIRDICILLRSTDDGETWGDESLVAAGYNETSYAFTPDGRLLAAARSESGSVSILCSDDLGRSWSEPVTITRQGEHPADLTVLQSGAVQLTFGRRIRPLGCGVLLSDDNGRTWNHDREVLLAGDGIESVDLGYPSTVQLDDGTIVTLLYYASGSQMGSDSISGWGAISCQAIHYREEDIR